LLNCSFRQKYDHDPGQQIKQQQQHQQQQQQDDDMFDDT